MTVTQFRLNALVNLSAGQFRSNADGILDGVGVGAAVRDDADALDAQQRRSSVLGIIHALLEVLKGGTGKNVSDLARYGSFQRLA